MKYFLNRSLLTSYAQGAGTILDLFGTSAPVVKRGTLEDDFQSVCRAFQEVGEDFALVLSSEESAASRK
jgi:hypothetical protein